MVLLVDFDAQNDPRGWGYCLSYMLCFDYGLMCCRLGVHTICQRQTILVSLRPIFLFWIPSKFCSRSSKVLEKNTKRWDQPHQSVASPVSLKSPSPFVLRWITKGHDRLFKYRNFIAPSFFLSVFIASRIYNISISCTCEHTSCPRNEPARAPLTNGVRPWRLAHAHFQLEGNQNLSRNCDVDPIGFGTAKISHLSS